MTVMPVVVFAARFVMLRARFFVVAAMALFAFVAIPTGFHLAAVLAPVAVVVACAFVASALLAAAFRLGFFLLVAFVFAFVGSQRNAGYAQQQGACHHQFLHILKCIKWLHLQR